MILSLLIGLATADVPALRDQGWSLEFGQAQLSAAAPLGQARLGQARLGLAAHTAGWSPEVQLGWSYPLLGPQERRWTSDVVLAGGALFPWQDPALVLTGTAGLRGARRGDHVAWEGLLLSPLALELAPSRVLRVPVRAETRLGVRAGPTWISGRASIGASWVTGGLRSTDAELGLGLAWVGRG